MSWWVWLFVGWIVLSSVSALWLGRVAAIARSRERAGRDQVLEAAAAEYRSGWSVAG
jgi:hypothetical protein